MQAYKNVIFLYLLSEDVTNRFWFRAGYYKIYRFYDNDNKHNNKRYNRYLKPTYHWQQSNEWKAGSAVQIKVDLSAFPKREL